MFATHNTESSDFTIKSVTDISLMGSYMVNIIANICVPDDETGATCTTMVDAYRIQFIVDPCQVEKLQTTKSFI